VFLVIYEEKYKIIVRFSRLEPNNGFVFLLSGKTFKTNLSFGSPLLTNAGTKAVALKAFHCYASLSAGQ
jgi:hypothetical protein